MTTSPSVPANRAQRRARATRRERSDVAGQNHRNDPSALDSALDLDAISKAVGVPVTARDVDDAVASLDTVNLDELIAPTVSVALMERIPREVITLDDGTTVTHYTLKPRTAEITLWASVETQLKALTINRKRRETSVEEQVPAMLALLLEMWQQSEPDMTLEKLRFGLDVYRISRLFNLAFTRPSRP